MIESYKKVFGDISVLRLGYFDIYDSRDDRIDLKGIINKLFAVDDEIYFFFRREEDLTDTNELEILRKDIFDVFSSRGEFKYLRKIDSRRFDAIARITSTLNTPNFIIDLWKYFYSCSFFKPINNLTFIEYEEYLTLNGVDDVDGLKHLRDHLCEFKIIKGLGGDNLTISYSSGLNLDEKIVGK